MTRTPVVFAVLAAAAWGCRTGDVPPRERPAVLTIRDFAAYEVDLKSPGGKETLERTTYFDGTFSVDYMYERDSMLYLAVTIQVEKTVRDARVLGASTRAGLTMGFRAQGLNLQEDTVAPVGGGDDSYFASVVRDSMRVGHVAFVRHGSIVYGVVLTGLVFDAPDELRRLIGPKLDHLDSLKIGKT
jgi:hypothetical protein